MSTVRALIWVLIKRRILFVDPSRGAARYVWPAAATTGCLVLLSLGATMEAGGLRPAAVEEDPYATRVARAFGTPVPGQPAPAERVITLPTPRPSLRQAQLPAIGPETRASRYVGAIRATLYNVQFLSPALGRDMRYFVYLPPGSDQENRRYPTLYMLHGNSGSYEEWLAYGLVTSADGLIAAREILPMVIVFPQGDFSYWVNHVGDGLKFGDYFVVDLVRHINATYRVLPGYEHRAVGGLSMGATGALVSAFRHPDTFGIVGAHSPALPAEGERDFLGTGLDYRGKDPISLSEQVRSLRSLTIWIDVGNEDPWLSRVEELSAALDRRQVDYELNVFPGDHWGPYWTEHITDYLRFYDAALNPERRL